MSAGCPVCDEPHTVSRLSTSPTTWFWWLVAAAELYRAGRRAGRRAGVAEVHRAARVIGGDR